MFNILTTLKRWWVNFLKYGEDFVDLFKPRGDVELVLRFAEGPRKGEVAKTVKGRNIITSWLSADGSAPTSGRDMMRRLLAPASVVGSLAGQADASVTTLQLGSGTTAETSGDTDLEAAIVGTDKTITDVEFSTSNPYVTFIVEYDETEANATLSEAALYSGRGDFIARKTFGSFTKTNEFTLEIRWTIRF